MSAKIAPKAIKFRETLSRKNSWHLTKSLDFCYEVQYGWRKE